MSAEKIMEFLIAPQFPDIIAYLLLAVAFIRQMFIQKFVRKDNSLTVLKVDDRIKALDGARSDLAKAIAAAKQERGAFEKARLECENKVSAFNAELNRIREITQYGFGNVDSLVKSGVANKIARLLSDETEETEKINEIKETPAETEESKECVS